MLIEESFSCGNLNNKLNDKLDLTRLAQDGFKLDSFAASMVVVNISDRAGDIPRSFFRPGKARFV